MSISLALSGGKPCCNKKTGKNTVACKFNRVAVEADAVEADKDLSGELKTEELIDSPKLYKCNTENDNKCAPNGSNKPWWKFWAKKSVKNCPCKQALSAESAATTG